MPNKMSHEISRGKTLTIISIIIFFVCVFLSWIVTCGIIKLITICFGLAFTWKIASGIWLILILISGFIKGLNNKQ